MYNYQENIVLFKWFFVCFDECFFFLDEINDMDDSYVVIGNIDGGELVFGRKIILLCSGLYWVEYFWE